MDHEVHIRSSEIGLKTAQLLTDAMFEFYVTIIVARVKLLAISMELIQSCPVSRNNVDTQFEVLLRRELPRFTKLMDRWTSIRRVLVDPVKKISIWGTCDAGIKCDFENTDARAIGSKFRKSRVNGMPIFVCPGFIWSKYLWSSVDGFWVIGKYSDIGTE